MTPTVIIIHNPTVWNAKDNDGDHNESARRAASNTGGNHQRGNGNSIVFCVSSLVGMEDIISRPDTFVTTYEKVKGYERQVVIDDVLQWEDPEETIPTMETIPPEMPDKAQYDSVWPNNDPEKDEPLMGIPSGYNTHHLTLEA